MAQAPGYMKLIDLADPPLMSTPAAVSLIMGIIAKREYLNLPGAHIGGATSEVLIWQELKIALCLPRVRLKVPEAVACLGDTHSLEPIRAHRQHPDLLLASRDQRDVQETQRPEPKDQEHGVRLP